MVSAVIGTIIYGLYWLLLATSVALPLLLFRMGYWKNIRQAFFVILFFVGGIFSSIVMYSFLENTEALRATLGSEAHEGLALALYVLSLFVAGPSILLGFLGYLLGRFWKIRRSASA